MFWGISSALDLYEEYVKAFKLPDKVETAETAAEAGGDAAPADGDDTPAALNILLCGAADPRHIIKTLAKRYTHARQPQLNFYVLEASEEIMARSMLLLGLALEPPKSFSLVCKTHLFMDIFGNTMLRPSSHHYMAAKARSLQLIVCDEDVRRRLAPVINIDRLKYKERDGLETAFSFWQPNDKQIFDIQRYWEQRLRSLLKTRYDHRQGAFDWDLCMTLKYRGGEQICSQEYRYWRESGVAFVFPEYEHCKPNKTLAAAIARNGPSFVHRGYLGDMQTGPFCAFGLRTSEEQMHHSEHGINDYRATDITERNLLEIFHELQTQTVYKHDSTISRRYGATQLLMTPLLTHNEADITEAHESYDKPWIQVPKVQVNYISSLDMFDLQKGDPRWQEHFDIGFLAWNFYKFVGKEFFGALREKSLFIMETKLMTVERKEHVKEFETKIRKLLKESGLRPCINYQALNSSNMFLKYKKIPDSEKDGDDNFQEEKIKDNDDDENENENEDEVDNCVTEASEKLPEKETTLELPDDAKDTGVQITEIVEDDPKEQLDEFPKELPVETETETADTYEEQKKSDNIS